MTQDELERLAEMVAERLAPTRLAYTEPEAAAMLGVRQHVLRDARIRGELVATKVGGRIAYERSELESYLARNRDCGSRIGFSNPRP